MHFEPKNRGLEDDYPFQFGYLLRFQVNLLNHPANVARNIFCNQPYKQKAHDPREGRAPGRSIITFCWFLKQNQSLLSTLEMLVIWDSLLVDIHVDIPRKLQHTPRAHPGNPPSQLWKEFHYSLLVKV